MAQVSTYVDPVIVGGSIDATTDILPEASNIIYVGKHGNNSSDGKDWRMAKLTFAGARAAIVAAGDAAANNRYVIYCPDAGIYAEDLSGLDHVDIWAPRAAINPTNTHTIIADVAWRIGRVTVPTAKTGFTKSAGANSARVRLSYLNCEGTAGGFLITSGSLTIDLRQVTVVDGYGIGAVGATGQIDGRITTLDISGTGIGVGTASAGANIDLRIGCIEDTGSGTGIYVGNVVSSVNIIASRIACGTAWNILAAGTLNVHCPNVTGTQIGIVNQVTAGGTANFASLNIVCHLGEIVTHNGNVLTN